MSVGYLVALWRVCDAGGNTLPGRWVGSNEDETLRRDLLEYSDRDWRGRGNSVPHLACRIWNIQSLAGIHRQALQVSDVVLTDPPYMPARRGTPSQ